MEYIQKREWIIIGIVFAFLASIVIAKFLSYENRPYAPYRSEQEKWCVENGGQYFTGGFGAGHCQFLPTNKSNEL